MCDSYLLIHKGYYFMSWSCVVKTTSLLMRGLEYSTYATCSGVISGYRRLFGDLEQPAKLKDDRTEKSKLTYRITQNIFEYYFCLEDHRNMISSVFWMQDCYLGSESTKRCARCLLYDVKDIFKLFEIERLFMAAFGFEGVKLPNFREQIVKVSALIQTRRDEHGEFTVHSSLWTTGSAEKSISEVILTWPLKTRFYSYYYFGNEQTAEELFKFAAAAIEDSKEKRERSWLRLVEKDLKSVVIVSTGYNYLNDLGHRRNLGQLRSGER